VDKNRNICSALPQDGVIYQINHDDDDNDDDDEEEEEEDAF